MLTQHLSDRLRIEDAMLVEVLLPEPVLDEGFEVGLQPHAHRPHKPLLAMVQDLPGQQVFHRLFQQMFLVPKGYLHPVWDGRAELHDLVVQKRHPDFQRVTHAHAVSAGQDVLGQVGFDVAVEDPVQGFGGVEGVEGAQHQVPSGLQVFPVVLRSGKEAVTGILAQHGHEPEIPGVVGQGRGTDETLEVVHRVMAVGPFGDFLHQFPHHLFPEKPGKPVVEGAEFESQVPFVAPEEFVAAQA